MNKFAICSLLFALCTANAAQAAPSYLTKDNAGGYRVTYDYRDKPKNDWYMTFRAELNFLSWKNEYSYTDAGPDFVSEDKYNMKPVFGGSLAVGKKYGYNWRGEFEVGYTGQFSDKDNGSEFSISAPYALLNGMYDFSSGIYLGAGVGMATPMLTMDSIDFAPGGRSKMSVSPMVGLMAGFTHKLDDNFVLDLRYRISGLTGTKIRRTVDLTSEIYETKVGLVLDNAVSVGIRYEF